MRWSALVAIMLLAAAGRPLAAAEGAAMAQYPRKSARTLHTEAEVQLARQNLARYPAAAALCKAMVGQAEAWSGWSDERLASLVTPPQVPRAFNISFSGCPVHGREAFQTGNYSFAIDLARPFKVKCPVGGEEYPSNDFAAYLASGMQDRSLLTGPYPDDGWGWRKPGEEKKYWFVAYYNHWAYLRHVIPGALALSRAYLLTGERRYAHQAIILLDRIADVYPAMDHNRQSRYAAEFAPSYTGKIVNAIWETGVGRSLCEAFDNVWEAIDADQPAQAFLGKRGPQIRANIERNLVAEVVRAVYEGRIRGNFGMHQETLLTAAIVAQAGEERQVADYLLYHAGEGFALEGYHYALANYFTREGISCRETAPGYCGIWREQVVGIADLMKRFGINLFRQEAMPRIMLAPERMVVQETTPAIGDSGAVVSGAVHPSARTVRIGYREYGDEAFARLLAGGFDSYEDLFEPPVMPRAAPAAPAPASDLLDSYGLALLRSPRRPVACSLFYGPSPGHGHHDKLNIDLYSAGHKLLPDLGYPQFAAEDPEPPGWSRNTVSHNTVVVDARQQTTVRPGRVRAFAASSTVQLVEVDAPAAYQGRVQAYRRALLLVDGQSYSYAVDIFRVVGGAQHDYVLHGPEGEFSVQGLALSPPAQGTLAGPQVPYGFFYDDPRFAEQGQQESYYSYQGSGFSFLLSPQRAQAQGPWWADWRRQADPRGHLRITWLPQHPQEQFVCDGRPPYNPSNPPLLKYILSRRQGGQPLASTFVALVEPYRDAPRVRQAASLTQGAGEEPVALQIETAEGLDLVAARGEGGAWSGGEAACSAHCGVLSLDRRGELRRAFLAGAGELRRGSWGLRVAGELGGRVLRVDYARCQAVVRLKPGAVVASAALAGSMVRFENERRTACFFIAGARRTGGELVLTLTEPPEAGLVLVSGMDQAEGWLRTRNHLPQRDVARYDGMTVADEAGRPLARISSVTGDEEAQLNLERLPGAPLAFPDADGDGKACARLYEFGPGDQAAVAAVVHVARTGAGCYQVQANVSCELLLPCPGTLPTGEWAPEGKAARPLAARRVEGDCLVTIGARALGQGRGTLRVRPAASFG